MNYFKANNNSKGNINMIYFISKEKRERFVCQSY